jgi:hypothetical protein
MFFINPFIYAGGGDFESIATVTVGAGGASSIEFTSIPSTFQHLQVRMISRSTQAASLVGLQLRVNGISAATYARHQLYGDGSSAVATGQSGYSAMFAGTTSAASGTASAFGAAIIDLLDYANTAKNPVARTFGGVDLNGSGYIHIDSGLRPVAEAVSSITLVVSAGNFAQHSTAALYGVKAP